VTLSVVPVVATLAFPYHYSPLLATARRALNQDDAYSYNCSSLLATARRALNQDDAYSYNCSSLLAAVLLLYPVSLVHQAIEELIDLLNLANPFFYPLMFLFYPMIISSFLAC
jgi:hypothetical protein